MALTAAQLGSPSFYISVDDPTKVTLTSGRVSQVDDLSGSANHAAQSTAGNRPYYGVGPDGMPELIYEFDGQHALNIPSGLTTNAAGFTMMAVLSVPNPSGDGATGGTFVDIGQIGTSNNFIGLYSSVSDSVFGRPYTYFNGALVTYDRCILPLGRQIFSLSINGTSQRGRMMRGPDMAYLGVAAQATSNVTGGRIGGAVSHSPFAGRISAWAIWNRVLGEEEHRAYHYALGRFWKCPLRRGRRAIVCIGDSITGGYNSTNAINWPSLLDRDKLDADIFCVARASEMANETATRVTHTGHANTIASLWRGCEQVVALVGVGRNDIASGQTPATALTRVAAVSAALSSNFTHKLGVEQIHTQYVADADRVTFNAGLPAIFPQGVAAVASTFFGALTTIAGENSLYAGESRSNDYIHPSAAGHAQIAAAVQHKLERLDWITADRIASAAATKLGAAAVAAINADATQTTARNNSATAATKADQAATQADALRDFFPVPLFGSGNTARTITMTSLEGDLAALVAGTPLAVTGDNGASAATFVYYVSRVGQVVTVDRDLPLTWAGTGPTAIVVYPLLAQSGAIFGPGIAAKDAAESILTLAGDGTAPGHLARKQDVAVTVDAPDPRGPGDTLWTATIEAAGDPVPDADVWVTGNVDGTNVIAGTLQTNSEGKASFLLSAGVTYYLWMQKDGVNSITGESFTVPG